MSNIVWLASYPKSGNTWVRAFLDNLMHDAARPLAVDRPSGMFAQGESAIGWYRIADPRPPAQWKAADIARMRPRVHKMIADSAEGTVFCKTHNALTTINGHPTVNMAVSAGAIYIVRNPLDIVLSFADFQACSVDTAIANTSFATMRALEDRDGFDERSPAQERFFRRGVAGGWRDSLTQEQAARIAADHGKQMARFGYLAQGEAS